MEFHDAVLGSISFSEKEIEQFVAELLEAPEVLRLRQMRLVNFDGPILQDLATARRYSHSVGVCKIADTVGRRSNLDLRARQTLIAAALVHDVGVLPFGHLVEAVVQRRFGSVSHESMFQQIVHGTYHPANKYHQINEGQSLKLAHILDKWKINKDAVIGLVSPQNGAESPISASIDLDNIDNVHRMAVLLGWRGAVDNARALIAGIQIGNFRSGLKMKVDAQLALQNWMEYRRRIYTLMIAHPSIVAYNALLSDIVEAAIENEVIRSEEWFLNDKQVERALEAAPCTGELFRQLNTGLNYRLVDYVWFLGEAPAPLDNWLQASTYIAPYLPTLSGQALKYFIWPDQKRVSRQVRIEWVDGQTAEIGRNSVSLLVALVSTQKTVSQRWSSAEALRHWRVSTRSAIASAFPTWDTRPIEKQGFTAEFNVGVQSSREQYELF